MLTGILMTFVPGSLMLLPLLLGGFLVGEAISAASRRRGGRDMQIAAFFCAVLGPLFGRAVVLVLLAQVPAAVALNGAVASMGPLGLLLLLAGGVIASTRIDR
jgi:hypothetical protein